MKLHRWTIQLMVMAVLIFLNISCEYDGPTALYTKYKDNTAYAPNPVITGMEPAGTAAAGNLTLTILGSNFSEVSNLVYFDDVKVKILSSTSTSITIARPAIVGVVDTITVASAWALEFAYYTAGYTVDSAYTSFGGFTGVGMDAISFDAAGNAYAADGRDLFKIEPNGTKTQLGDLGRTGPDDTRFGPGGKLYYTSTYRDINVYDFTVEDDEEYFDSGVSASQFISCDFDNNGILFAGGSETDLMAISGPGTGTATLEYAAIDSVEDEQDQIDWIRVYDGYVYVLATLATGLPTRAIWRHQIMDANGNIGGKELVLDWSKAENGYNAQEINCFTFSSDGTMYIGTTHSDPVMTYNMNDGSQGSLLPGILPSPALKLVWGNSNDLYLISSGNTGINNIDMGALTGAPNHGRGL